MSIVDEEPLRAYLGETQEQHEQRTSRDMGEAAAELEACTHHNTKYTIATTNSWFKGKTSFPTAYSQINGEKAYIACVVCCVRA